MYAMLNKCIETCHAQGLHCKMLQSGKCLVQAMLVYSTLMQSLRLDCWVVSMACAGDLGSVAFNFQQKCVFEPRIV